MNFVPHELNPSVLPFADEYCIIDCRDVNYDFSNLASFKSFVDEKIQKMMDTPGWDQADAVCIVFTKNEKDMFALMCLQTALSGMDIYPEMWMEISEVRGMYISMGDFHMIGLDKMMTRWHGKDDVQNDVANKLTSQIKKE